MKHKVFNILALVALLLSVQSHAAVILQYHHVSSVTPAITSIKPELFESHLAFLEKEGFRVWPLMKLVEHLKSKKAIPDKVVVITFDDAYVSIYASAFPVLKAHGYPFTVFVSTQPVDDGVRSFMDWQQLRELSMAGGAIANHTRSHAHLVRQINEESETQWLARIRSEISDAQARIENEIGEAPMVLAYPYGEFDTRVQALVEEMGYVAFGQQSGAVDARYDLTSLPRFPVNQHFGELSQFKTKLYSLPLPLRDITPAERIRHADIGADSLTLRFYPVEAWSGRWACYFSGKGKVETAVEQSAEGVLLKVVDALKIPVGRSRLNCTVPSKDSRYSGRFHWYSYFWMRPKPSGAWYPEP